jgi:hypothetical protein
LDAPPRPIPTQPSGTPSAGVELTAAQRGAVDRSTLRPGRSLHMFAGPGPMAPDGLAWQALARGSIMDEVDILQDHVRHQMLVAARQAPYLEACREGVYGWGHFGIPCTTFTVILALQRRVLRLRHRPWGRGGLCAADQKQVNDHNALIKFSCRAMRLLFDAGGQFTFENVADRGDPTLPCFWAERSSMCPLSLVPCVVALMQYAHVIQITVPMCAFAPPDADPLPAQKWLTFFATPGAAAVLAPIRYRTCPHGLHAHALAAAAIGRDADGASRAALSAAYPLEACTWLSLVAEEFASDDKHLGPAAPAGAQIGCGSTMHPTVLAAIEAARNRPIRFADFKRLVAVPPDQRRARAFPCPHDVAPELAATPTDVAWAVVIEGTDDERPCSFAPGMLRPLRSHHGVPGLPPGRLTYERIWRVVNAPPFAGRRQGYDMIIEWTRLAFADAPKLARGEQHAGPGTVEVAADLKEEVFRHVLLDCRDPTDVVVMRRSTRHTVFPGSRQMNRANFRAAGEATGWYDVDPDIMAQAGEGGIESRSSCPRVTILAWHHRGVRENFAAAHTVSVQEYGDEWLLGPYPLPPCEPCRVIPNNVVLQQRPKLNDEGQLVPRVKPRVTTNESFGDDASPNAGVARDDKTTHLPSHQTHAEAAGIVDACFAPSGHRGEQYCNDLTGAYSFLVTQRADWWLQVRFWILHVDGREDKIGFFLQPRSLFGGGWMPNRFMRVTRVKRGRTRQRQMAFDRAHPYPAQVLAVVRERAALQRRGLLPAGADQLTMSALQDFVDDESGAAGSDRVAMPAELRHVDVAAIVANTVLSGARPSAPDSRNMVHCCFSIDTSEDMGFEHAMDKVQCGDGITVLGIRCDILADRSDCPPVKAEVMTAEMQLMHDRAQSGARLERVMIERNTGRICNISQIDPSLMLHIHAGYALGAAMARPGHGRAKRLLQHVAVKPTGEVGRQFCSLLQAALQSLAEGAGVPLVHAPAFPAHTDPGVLTVTSDASGEDGVGGFAFHPDQPDAVWIVHAAWPSDVLDAITYSAMRTRVREVIGVRAACSMPAAEAFGGWAVAETVRRAGQPFTSVVAVGDCLPVAFAISSAKSTSHVMRQIVADAHDTAPAWLGVHVRRKWNSDADLLSHPASVQHVVDAARRAGLRVHEMPVHDHCWLRLRAAIQAALRLATDAAVT